MSSVHANSPGRLVLRLFGPPRIELDGEEVILGRRKAVALLTYLAVTGQRHRRDALVNLLWPDSDSTRGRAALRRTLFALNKALAPGFFEVDRSSIGLAPGAQVWVDVRAFEEKLAQCERHDHPRSETCSECVVPLTEAVELARGDFMAGFSLKDSVNFDDWQIYQAETLRRDLGDALERLVNWHSGQREFELAARFARRRLALDPLDEAAHRSLMRLYAWSGKRSAALSQYDDCVAVLEDQLGVPPQEETGELYRAIKAGRVPALSLSSPGGPPPRVAGRPPGGLATTDDSVQPAEEALTVLSEAVLEPPAFLEKDQPYEQPLFVARERELTQLDALLKQALRGQGRVAFVTGEAGSGKTSLVQEFTRRAQKVQPELLAATGNCNAYTGIGDPYLPFREILELLTGGVQARWAAGAMSKDHARRLWDALPFAVEVLVESGPDLIDTFVPQSPLLERVATCAQLAGGSGGARRLDQLVEQVSATPGAQGAQQSHLFNQVTRVLQALAEHAPLLLVVDDLQWADLGSVSLLFHLGRNLAGSRILIVGAYRPEEVVSGRVAAEEGQRHPLAPVLHELQRDFGDIVVDVDRAERDEFVGAVLDSEPNRLGGAFREMLYQQTRGHPLFTIELLRGMQERGDLVRDADDCWIAGRALDWDTLPARVEAAIAERVDRLSRPLVDALRVASVEGEEFTAEIVAQVLGVGERDLVPLLSSELDRRHRLVRAQSIQRLGSRRLSRYRFRNFLFQRYVYDSMDRVERSYLHEDVGYALEGLYADTPGESADVAPQLARQFEEAGITDKAIHYLHQAGLRAVQVSAWKEALAHLTRGLALLDDLPEAPDRDNQELDLQLALSLARVGFDGYGPAVQKALTRARDLCQALGRTARLSRVVGELSVYHYVRAEYTEALGLAEEALQLAQEVGDALLIGLGHTALGFILFTLGELESARTHFQHLIPSYRPDQHHRGFLALRSSDAGLTALAYDACCLWCLGYPDQAAKRSEEAVSLAHRLGHPFSLADVLCYGVCLFNEMRRTPEPLMAGAEELKALAGAKLHGWLGHATWHWGEALAMSGRVEEGIEEMRRGLDIQSSGPERCHRTGCLLWLAEALGRAGRPEQGLEAAAETLARVEEDDERFLEAELHRVQGDLLLALGDVAGAEAGFRRAIEVARRQNAKSWELRATTSLARLWQAQGRGEEGCQVVSEVYGWFTEGFETPDLQEARALLEEPT